MGPGSILVTPSDTTVWLVIGGLLAAITGAFGFANEEKLNLVLGIRWSVNSHRRRHSLCSLLIGR